MLLLCLNFTTRLKALPWRHRNDHTSGGKFENSFLFFLEVLQHVHKKLDKKAGVGRGLVAYTHIAMVDGASSWWRMADGLLLLT